MAVNSTRVNPALMDIFENSPQQSKTAKITTDFLTYIDMCMNTEINRKKAVNTNTVKLSGKHLGIELD